MSDKVQDDLWPYFVPLWTDLRKIAPELLLVGGYGLFLKQQWLVSQLRFLSTESGDSIVTERGGKLVVHGVQSLIPIHQWNDQTPRVTKDFDFITSLDLIASNKEQRRLDEVLKKHDFNVVTQNARWQFEKKVGPGRSVVLDFHAPAPAEERSDLRVQSRRVKPQPSLGQTGIHGRVNPEAASSKLCPFSFNYNGVEIVLPNPVTLILMKLVAMNDRRSASQNTSLSPDEREMEDRQARKHAEDVCRVIAMMTREESELASGVLELVRTTAVFRTATAIFSQSFQKLESWGSQVVAEMWQAEDLRLIQNTLAAWLR